MWRWGLVLLGFWLALGAIVLVVALSTEDSPKPREKPPGPMTCASLQKRAEKCASGLSDLAGELYARYARAQGESELTINAKVTVVITVAHSAISEKKVARYCKQYWDSERPLIRRGRKGLAECFARPGCEAFIDCVRELAKRVDFTSL